MSLLVTPEELSPELESSVLLLIDLRPVEDYCENHLPGAVHLDLFGISSVDTDPAPLNAFFWIIEHLLASRGVSSDVPVVVYDDSSGVRAARAFWFLEFFGHPNTRLLDGGYHAWVKRQLPVTRQASRPKPTDWKGTRDAGLLAGWRDVNDRLGRPDAVIVDTRSDGEYCGTTIRAARGGAVPGAIHLEWTRNLGPDGAFKSQNDLKAMYERRDYIRSGSSPIARVVSPSRRAAADRLSSRATTSDRGKGRSRRSAHRASEGPLNGEHR
jgi:thiosulfate/3-mercaptopyruvate sulfurtransferase